MKRFGFGSLALAGLLTLVACASEREPAESSTATLFTGMRLVPGDGSGAIDDGALVVDDGRILAVGPATQVEAPAGAAVVELDGRTVMPTIHSLHVHLGYLDASNSMTAENYSRESVLEDLDRHAYYGVSAVLVLGSDAGDTALQIREDQRAGRAGGTRLFTAGRGITSMGGWPTVIAAISAAPQQVETEEEAREAVRTLAAQDVDAVKIWVDDAGGRLPKIAAELYGAAIDEANQHDLLTFAHVFYLEDAKGLVEAGINGLAHSVRDVEVDEELVRMMKERDVVYIPTLAAHEAAVAYADEAPWIGEAAMTETVRPDVVRNLTSEDFAAGQRANAGLASAREQVRIAFANAKKLADAGVRVAVGTDSGTTNRFPGFFEHLEMELFVEAGLSPEQAIEAATATPAAVLGTNDGVLAPGRDASFLVLGGNPLDDITETRNIEDVYLRGERLDRAAIRTRLLEESSD